MTKTLLTICIIFSTICIASATSIIVSPNTDVVIQAKSYYQSYNGQTITISAGSSLQVYNTLYVNIGASDTLLVDATNTSNGFFVRNPIQFKGLVGSVNLPIIIKNKPNKKIQIRQLNLGSSYGLNFHFCSNIKVSGLENGNSYMLSIANFASTASAGISLDKGTKNVEIEHLEISNIGAQAIMFKSAEPFNGSKVVTDTAYFRTYATANTLGKGSFHDNYIHNVGNEGFFIGSTIFDIGNPIIVNINAAFAASLPTNNVLKSVNGIWQFTPHFADSILIYNNITDTTGYDGIQVSMAKFYRVYNNKVKNWATKKIYGQNAGIFIGTPSIGETYNNKIINGSGAAIQCFGVKNRFFNNVIVRPNLDSKEPNWWNINAIYFNDKACTNNTLTLLGINYTQTLFEAAHNTIILNKNDSGRALFFVQNFHNQTVAKCYNNLGVQDRNPDITNEQNRVLANPIFSANPIQTNFSSTNNFSSTDLQAVGFVDVAADNYELVTNCQACRNAQPLGASNTLITRDLNNLSRIFDNKTNSSIPNPSFGSFESKSYVSITIPSTIEVVVQATSFYQSYNQQTVQIAPGGSLQVYNYLYVNIAPGDTLQIDATNLTNGIYNRTPLTFQGLTGNSLFPIVIKNKNGKTIQITQANSQSSFGITFKFCESIKVTGLENGQSYRLKINGIYSVAGMGVIFDRGTKNVELSHVEISNTGAQGVQFKSPEPYNNSKIVTDTAYFRQYVNLATLGTGIFYNNYIHDVGSEGFYIGSTSYDVGDGLAITINQTFAESLPNNGIITFKNNSWRFLPHLAQDIQVYNNKIENTGWDGIQVASAKKYIVYNNTIKNWGQSKAYNQMYGIIIGSPSMGDVYNNTINTGNGSAIQCFGIRNRFFNNLIIRPNLDSKEATWWAINAVYLSDKSCTPQVLERLGITYSQTLFEAMHNTIIMDKNDSGRAISFLQNFANNTIAKCYSNLAVRDANPESLNTNSITLPNPIFIANPQQTNFSLANNIVSTDLQTIDFIDINTDNYNLNPNCVICNSAPLLTQPVNDKIYFDLNNNSRKVISTSGTALNPTFGCYEPIVSNTNKEIKTKKEELELNTFPNPIKGQELNNIIFEIKNDNKTAMVYKIELVDFIGKSYEFDLINIENENRYRLNLTNYNYLAGGLYFGNILANNKRVLNLKLLIE
jgi:hypothetical protein